MKASGLDNSLFLNERMIETFSSSLTKTKDRLHSIELSYFLEPPRENEIEHSKWATKLDNLVNHRKVDNFPTRHDIRVEMKQIEEVPHDLHKRGKTSEELFIRSLEKLKTIRSSNLSKRKMQIMGKRDGDTLRVIQKYSGQNTFFTKSRTLVKKSVGGNVLEPLSSVPPWIGPCTYTNTDPDFISSKPHQTSYQHTFKATSRDTSDPKRTRQIHEKVKKWSEYYKNIPSKGAPASEDIKHLKDLRDHDNDSLPSHVPSRRQSRMTASSSSSVINQVFLHRQPSKRSTISRQSSYASMNLSTSIPNTSRIDSNMLNFNGSFSISIQDKPIQISRKASTASSSRRMSMNETHDFATKLLIESNIQKYNAVKKDYTLGGFDGLTKFPSLLSSCDEEIDQEESEVLTLSMTLGKGIARSISMSKEGSMARKTSKSEYIPLESTTGNVCIPAMDNSRVDECISATYPHFTEDIEPYVQKWFKEKNIYAPKKLFISKNDLLSKPTSIDLEGITLPVESEFECDEQICPIDKEAIPLMC